jgi:hypothetical protein
MHVSSILSKMSERALLMKDFEKGTRVILQSLDSIYKTIDRNL